MTKNGAIQASGRIGVQRRDPSVAAGLPIRYLDESVDFPVGQSLLDAIHDRYDAATLSESTMISRYASEEMGVDWRDVLDTLLEGEPLGSQSVKRFLTNTGLKPLFSPIVEDGLRLGLDRVAANWQQLIAQTIPVDSTTYEYYEFNNAAGDIGQGATGTSEYRLKSIGQGAPIPTARVTVSGRSYQMFKWGRGIEWTDESKSAPLDLAAMWFQQVGLQLGWDYFEQIVDMLLNGYHADGSDDAPVLATAVAATITDADIYTAIGTMQTFYGYDPDVMVMSLQRSVALRTMENSNGFRIFPGGISTTPDGPLAAGLPRIMLSSLVPNDKILFVDTGMAMVRFVNKPFGTEFDRVPQTQTEGSYGTEISLAVPLFAKARLILDS